MEDSVLRRKIRSIADGSLSVRTQDQEALPKRFFYLYGRMVDQIFRLVRMLAQELCQSEFRPLRFEYPIGEQEGTRPLQLATDSGDMVRVEGKVDRVDCYHGSSQDYIRVIDYKTGGKKFDLSRGGAGAQYADAALPVHPGGKWGGNPCRPWGGRGAVYAGQRPLYPGPPGYQRRQHCGRPAEKLLHERYRPGGYRGHRGHGSWGQPDGISR